MRAHGRPLAFREARDLAARLSGYADWAEMESLIGTCEPTPEFEDLPEAEQKAIKRFQIDHLRETGLSHVGAISVVVALHMSVSQEDIESWRKAR
jgi:hypothetical protein